jgi:predicted RNA-binding Zn-ribbon protein involved in translation (DUF1610 family)
MECPKCGKKQIFRTKFKLALRNKYNQIIGTKPQYSCLCCGFQWDIIERKGIYG